MRALVLGATGFIGGHIVRVALKQGWDVRGLRRRHGASGHLGALPLEWVEADLSHEDQLAEAMRGREVVFHAAGYVPRSSRNLSQELARARRQIQTVIEAARCERVQRLVYTSSLTTIGTPPSGEVRLADERDDYLPGRRPVSPYYECKHVMEREVLTTASTDMEVVVLNPTAVFGPGDSHLSTGGILIWVARGRARVWLSVPLNVIDVRDVAAAHVRAASAGRHGERYILGGENRTVRELLNLAADVADVPPPSIELPLRWVELGIRLLGWLPPLARAGNHLRALRWWQGYNCEKAKRELELDARPLRETLEDALVWFQRHGFLP
jgi:dihydroflavonol-4-reductase